MVEAVVGRLASERAEDALYQEYLKYRTDPGPPPSLAAVRPQLVRFITYDQIKDLVLTLRSRSKIEILAPASPGAPPPAGSKP
jgi:peptidyl-prolyl cis-trans isomerase C